MTTLRTPGIVSRRSALAGLGAGGLSLVAHPALAQKAIDMATHPLVGTWISGAGPNDIGLNHWGADGSVSLQPSSTPAEVDGVTSSDWLRRQIRQSAKKLTPYAQTKGPRPKI